MLSNAALSRRTFFLLPALLLFLAAGLATGLAQTVVTDTGTFTGVPSPSDPAAVDVFFGIRYAASPEGAARWTPPQPPTPPPGIVLADFPGPACPQAGSTASAAVRGLPLSECLRARNGRTAFEAAGFSLDPWWGAGYGNGCTIRPLGDGGGKQHHRCDN